MISNFINPAAPQRAERLRLTAGLTNPITIGTAEQKIFSAGTGIAKRIVQNVGGNSIHLRLGFSVKSIVDDLVAWYNFEANGVNSVSGGVDLTASGTLAYAAGKVNNAATGDETGHFMAFDVYNYCFSTLKSSSFCGWFKIPTGSFGSDQSLMTQISADGGDPACKLYFDAAEEALMFESGNFVAQIPQAINENTWYFVSIVYNHITNQFTVGVNAANPLTVAFGPQKEGKDLYLGPVPDDTGDFAVDSVAIYNHALTPAELTILYNGGNGLAYAGLPAPSVSPYSLLLTPGTGTSPIIDLSWWSGDVYAMGAASSTINVVEAVGQDRIK